MIPSLPQSDAPAAQAARQGQLQASRAEFRYCFTYMAPLPFAETVPDSHHPSVAWRMKLLQTVLTILRNTLSITRHASRWGEREIQARIMGARADRQQVQNEILNCILEGQLAGRAQSLADIERMYVHIKRPPRTGESQTDAFFAHARVAGPNPMVIRNVPRPPGHFPVREDQFRSAMGDPDTLAAAGAEGRLFLADYAGLEGREAGQFPNGQKYLAAPLALFAVPAAGQAERGLRPVAIQCGQQPGAQNPVLTPRDGLAWAVAKAFVQMADGNYHQAISHLGQTHLVLEPFVLATCRQLAPVHPLHVLLMPHFEGTLNINDGAQANLMAPQGGVDRLMAGSIETSRQIAVEATQSYDFDRSTPREALATRGVADRDALPYFPYRDDALVLWNAIRGWVESYLKIYYHSDADVQADTELQAWIAELVSPDGGRMMHVGQGGRIVDLEYLIRTVTHVIFLAGPQHAAVNFPQYPVMSFTPNMPLALYQPPPTSATVSSPNGLLDWLPPLDMIQNQLSLGYLLGRPQITRLGTYAATDAGDLGRWVRDRLDSKSYFEDPRVAAPLAAYEAALAEAEASIEESNRTRQPYEFLLPSRIPQSINV